MARSNSKRSSATAIKVATSSVGFSAFLMDEVPDFNARSQKNGAKAPAASANLFNSSVPITMPNLLPALSVHKPAAATSASATPVVIIASGGGQREKDDIPVLEATKYGAFHSDEDEDDDEDDDDVIIGGGDEDDDSDDDDDGGAVGRDTFNEDVPVLQTLEDAQAFDRQRPLGSKKFSWRESSRQVTKRRKSRATPSRVPDPETLLRMSTQTEFSNSYSTSGSLISGKESLVTVERQIVCKGWLYKQADILYVLCYVSFFGLWSHGSSQRKHRCTD